MSAVAAARSALEAAAAAASSSSGSSGPIPRANGATSPMPVQALHVRWAVVHASSPIGARFVSELGARKGAASGASTTTTPGSAGLQSPLGFGRAPPQTQHSVVAILQAPSSASAASLEAAEEQQVESAPATAGSSPGSTSGAAATASPTVYTSLAQLLAQASSFDAVFIAPPTSPSAATASGSEASDRAAIASSVLSAGKAVLLPRPVELSAAQVRSITDVARKKSRWLGMPLDAESLPLAADECALGLRNNRSESSTLSWSSTLTVLDVLDDLRRQGDFPVPSTSSGLSAASSTPAPPSLLLQPNDSSEELLATEDDATPREFPTTPSSANSPSALRAQLYPRSSSRLSQNSETSLASASVGHASVGHGDAQGGDRGSLRAQLQELKHVLRQKQAIILQLEQKAGVAPGSSTTSHLSTSNGGSGAGARGGATAASVTPLTRRRLSSTPGLADDARAPSPSGSTSSRRRRRESAGLSTPPKSTLALESVRETGAGSSTQSLGEGFLSPTIASENRRAAVAASKENGDVTASPPPAGASGKVINALTTELEECKAALETNKTSLRTAERKVSALERQLLEVKAALGRSRAENETNTNIVGRKDRQAAEALERARKAEAEAKDLGRASREWGARVRVVEAELGEERRRAGKAEAGYEAISSAWKGTRDRWEAEVKALREEVKTTVEGNAEQARKMVALFQEAKTAWTGRESERESLDNTLERLRVEREKASEVVARQVQELVARLEQHELHIKSQDDTVEECAMDVRRIIRLARAADTTTPHA